MMIQPTHGFYFFLSTGSGSCPECNIPLRRHNFRAQLFEDSAVDKEVDIRKRVLKDFNKRQEDFSTLRDYNDYLEEIESIIFSLVYNIDIINTNKRIEQYKRENKDVIKKNQSRQSQEEIEIEELLELEKIQMKEKVKSYVNEEIEEKKKKLKAKEKLIDELMFSDVDAKSILASHAQSIAATAKEEQKTVAAVVKPANQFSSGVQIGLRGPQNFLPIPKQEELPLFKYTAPVFNYSGPTPPSQDVLKAQRYCSNIRAATQAELAGGYTESLSCHRALQEAMCGLFYVPQLRKAKDELEIGAVCDSWTC